MNKLLKLFSITVLITILIINVKLNAQTDSAVDSVKSKSIMFEDSENNPASPNFIPNWHDMITNIPNDWVKYFSVTWNANKIPLYLTVAATTAATIVTDDKSWQIVRKWHDEKSFNTKFDEFFTEFGDGRTQFGMAVAFGLYGWLGKDARALRTASQIVQTVLASGTVVQVLKHITGRETPNTASTPTGVWRFFPSQIEYHKHVSTYDAFPSGHVTTTLATVIVIAENYPEVWWIRPVGYVLTGLVAWGMVGTGIHWWSDYPLAVALGYTFGMIAAHPEGIPAEIAGKKINVMPMYVNKGFGISVGFSF
jgi:membrane-associated phospholipid phosphatase